MPSLLNKYDLNSLQPQMDHAPAHKTPQKMTLYTMGPQHPTLE